MIDTEMITKDNALENLLVMFNELENKIKLIEHDIEFNLVYRDDNTFNESNYYNYLWEKTACISRKVSSLLSEIKSAQ